MSTDEVTRLIKDSGMNILRTAPALGILPRLAGALNVVMVVAGGFVLVVTETSWNRCLADVDSGLTPLWRCQDQMANGQASIFFLLVPAWITGDLAFAAVWLRRMRSAGIRSAPASWTALGMSVAGFVTMLGWGTCLPSPTCSRRLALLLASSPRSGPNGLGAEMSLRSQASRSAVWAWRLASGCG